MSNTQTIKKTMQEPLEFIQEHGNLSKENLEKFIAQYCVPKTGATSTGPREVTILRDEEGNMLGRKCSVTGLWFPADKFSKGTTANKPSDTAKGKLYNESKKIEKDAQSLLDEAKDIADIQEKVAKYEEYDAKLAEAKALRLQKPEITAEMTEGGVETIEDLAKALNVPVITTMPAKEVEAE